ncbi:PadR family transcriptional regulator [Streptomyces mirabilis]|uniref:PadR family transcriptional regulator n=1 Tax=Streptomyces mirabilis TaxID=68239 RepID=UPI0033B5ABD1
MWIEILLLAELARGPRHGYELRREIEATTGHALSNNSLYPRLRRFVESAAVRRRAEEHAGTPPRHVYSITGVGRELLHDMLAALPQDTTDNGRQFTARVMNFDWLTTEEQLRILDAQERILDRKRAHVAGLSPSRAGSWSRRVLDYGVARLDADRAWVTVLRAEVEAARAADGVGRAEDDG